MEIRSCFQKGRELHMCWWELMGHGTLLVMVSFPGEGLFFLEKGPSKIILLLYFLEWLSTKMFNWNVNFLLFFLSWMTKDQTTVPEPRLVIDVLLESFADRRLSPTHNPETRARYKLIIDTTPDDTILHLLMQRRAMANMEGAFDVVGNPFPADSVTNKVSIHGQLLLVWWTCVHGALWFPSSTIINKAYNHVFLWDDHVKIQCRCRHSASFA